MSVIMLRLFDAAAIASLEVQIIYYQCILHLVSRFIYFICAHTTSIGPGITVFTERSNFSASPLRWFVYCLLAHFFDFR